MCDMGQGETDNSEPMQPFANVSGAYSFKIDTIWLCAQSRIIADEFKVMPTETVRPQSNWNACIRTARKQGSTRETSLITQRLMGLLVCNILHNVFRPRPLQCSAETLPVIIQYHINFWYVPLLARCVLILLVRIAQRRLVRLWTGHTSIISHWNVALLDVSCHVALLFTFKMRPTFSGVSARFSLLFQFRSSVCLCLNAQKRRKNTRADNNFWIFALTLCTRLSTDLAVIFATRFRVTWLPDAHSAHRASDLIYLIPVSISFTSLYCPSKQAVHSFKTQRTFVGYVCVWNADCEGFPPNILRTIYVQKGISSNIMTFICSFCSFH